MSSIVPTNLFSGIHFLLLQSKQPARPLLHWIGGVSFVSAGSTHVETAASSQKDASLGTTASHGCYFAVMSTI